MPFVRPFVYTPTRSVVGHVCLLPDPASQEALSSPAVRASTQYGKESRRKIVFVKNERDTRRRATRRPSIPQETRQNFESCRAANTAVPIYNLFPLPDQLGVCSPASAASTSPRDRHRLRQGRLGPHGGGHECAGPHPEGLHRLRPTPTAPQAQPGRGSRPRTGTPPSQESSPGPRSSTSPRTSSPRSSSRTPSATQCGVTR